MNFSANAKIAMGSFFSVLISTISSVGGTQVLPSYTPWADEPGEAHFEFGSTSESLVCKRANDNQLNEVNAGNDLLRTFLAECARVNSNSEWCEQLIRPNPASRAKFSCTYGEAQPHQLINPNRESWKFAFEAVKILEDLESMGISPCLIYNWWRPEPYNGNVGGASGRHPFGTSVDVRFCSDADTDDAFRELCKLRKLGRLRAIGYYGTTALHLGVGDHTANTWGRSCPQ